MVVFLKSLVISQFSIARNRTLCEVRLPLMQADRALGPSVGDTVTVITRVIKGSRPPSVCHFFKVCPIKSRQGLFPSCVVNYVICEPRGDPP